MKICSELNSHGKDFSLSRISLDQTQQ